MIQPKTFRYTLIVQGEEFELINAPQGWEETLLNYKRSDNYFGMIRSFTVPLKFVLDGAWLLRREFYTKRMGAVTVLKIEALDNSTWSYRLVYRGEVDYTEFTDEDESVTVNVTDVGVAEAVASSDKAVFEIPLTEENSHPVRLPGVALIDFAQMLVDPKTYGYNMELRVLPMSVEENDFINEHVTIQITEEEETNSLVGSENWFLQANQEADIVVSGRFEGFVQFNRRVDYTATISVRNQNNVVRGQVVTSPDRSAKIELDYSLPIKVVAGERLFMVLTYTGPNDGVKQVIVEYFPIRVTEEIISEPSITRAIHSFDLFQELINRMNEESIEVDSTLLKNSDLWITCGDAIREFENPIIKTSFVDFYTSIDSVLNVGFGIDSGVPRIEEKRYFFRNIPVMDLGNVKNFSLTVDQKFMFNSLKIGYKAQNYEEDQGREEFNQGQVWTSPNKKTDEVLDRLSIYRADVTGVSVLRRLTISDNIRGVDTESDNDIWMLKGSGQMSDGAYDLETGEDFDFISGVSNQKVVFNLDLSPKRNLMRSGSLLRIGLDGFESEFLRFASADRNADLVTQKSWSIVAERQDVTISSLTKPLFLPYLVRIIVDLPKNSWSFIDQNIFGYFTFKYRDAEFKGYIEEASNDIAKNSEREITLYLDSDTNLDLLIK